MIDLEGAAGQGTAGGDPRARGLVDLVTLWHSHGRPRGHSPRQWDRQREQLGQPRVIALDEPGGPDAEAWAAAEAAVRYALDLDPDVLGPVAGSFVEALRREPGRAVLATPTPLMAALALGALAGSGEVPPATRVVKGAVASLGPMDAWAQEVRIGAVQRAVEEAEQAARP